MTREIIVSILEGEGAEGKSGSFKIGVSLKIGFDTAAMSSWSGTLYIDSVRIR